MYILFELAVDGISQANRKRILVFALSFCVFFAFKCYKYRGMTDFGQYLLPHAFW